MRGAVNHYGTAGAARIADCTRGFDRAGSDAQTACRIERPFVIAEALATLDLETPIAHRQVKTDAARVFTIEHDRNEYVEFLALVQRAAEVGTRCGQRQLGKHRSREHDGIAYLMIGEPWEGLRIETVLPGGGGILELPAQQRMHSRSANQRIGLAGARMPMTVTLPGIAGQLHLPGSLREVGVEPWRLGQQLDSQRRPLDAGNPILAPPHGGKNPAGDAPRAQARIHITMHDSVRRDLDKHPATQLRPCRNSNVKAYRFTHIA